LLKTFDTLEKTWLAKSARLNGIQSVNYYVMSGFLRSRVHRIENRVPRIRKLSTVLRIKEIGSVQVHIGYLTFSLKEPA